MTYSLAWYLDRARARLGAAANDTSLANALGVNKGAVSAWRTKRAWPTDDKMERCADLAGVSRTLALVHLAMWRYPEVATWRALAGRLEAESAQAQHAAE